MVRRTTICKRMRAKLRQVKRQLRQRMHDPVPPTGQWLKSVVQGYFNYYAVPGNIVIGFCSEFFVRDKLVVSGDVTATANNIMASESLWRISIACELILLVCAVALTLIFYVLLRCIDLVFFGFACLVYGYLLFRSGYFPRTLGVLMAIAGLSYLANSFTLILARAYAGTIFLILVLALIGEFSLCLWLMVKGVNVPKWNEKARLAFG